LGHSKKKCNVSKFIVKNLILINFFTVKVPDMMSLGECLVQKNTGKLICNSPNDIISGNFDSEKVDQDGIFYYKDILHFFFEWPKYYTYKKNHTWG
jgi:hypothetical protein